MLTIRCVPSVLSIGGEQVERVRTTENSKCVMKHHRSELGLPLNSPKRVYASEVDSDDHISVKLSLYTLEKRTTVQICKHQFMHDFYLFNFKIPIQASLGLIHE